LLEIEVIKILLKENIAKKLSITNIDIFFLLDVDQFYGIEYEEFPAQIAQVAMWLIDHQMNMKVSETFGEYYVRLSLKKSAVIKHGNALRIDWNNLIVAYTYDLYAYTTNIMAVSEPEAVYETINVFTKKINIIEGNYGQANVVSINQPMKFDYIFGNPPFIGTAYQNSQQKADMVEIFQGINSFGMLDYVTAWYIKAAQYIQNTKTKVAFVSTNSISQGEQVGVLWNVLFNFYKIKIHFAHRTFKWGNEAKGNAAVHVVIVGFANFDVNNKKIFEYENIKGEPHELLVKNISPYLLVGKDLIISSVSKPLNPQVPEIKRGNSPYDGGYFLFSGIEKEEFLSKEPQSEVFFSLWLKDVDPNLIRKSPLILERIKKVKEFRENSPGKETQSYSTTPTLFRDKNNPDHFIVIPRVSSENRPFIPIGFFDRNYIAGDTCMAIMNGNLYHFGYLSSTMHMTWVKYVCGRLESRFRYSKDIVYNNFPWPENPTDKQKQTVESAAQYVLDVRAKFPESSLADLYDPNTMPPELVKAHQQLDKAVDLCYRPQPFINETKRIEFLFELYDKITSGMFGKGKKKERQ
jgi:hypothetical protein